MYSWEKKFGDVVRDTERHISKARDTLDSSGHTNGYNSFFDDSSKSRQGYKSEKRQLPLPDYSSPQVHGYLSDNNHGTYQLYSGSHDQSGGMVAVLSEKIDRQGKIVEDLTRQVLTLERENEKGSLRVRSLEQEVSSLRQRMSEDGVHLQTEQKVERFQWEMKGKLEELRSQLEIQNRLETPVNHDWRHAMMKELHELKRQTERECDSLHREIEVIRSKLVRYDVDLTGQQGDTKELARRLDTLKEEFQVNASKVSVQMNSLSNAAVTASRSRNGRLTHNSDMRRSPLQPAKLPDDDSPREGHRRRKKKDPDSQWNRKLPLQTTSTVRSSSAWSGEDVRRGVISLSSSSGDLSSDTDDDTTRPSTAKEVASTKVTDNSLTLSDLDSRSDPLTSSQHGFPALSLDSSSLDLDDD